MTQGKVSSIDVKRACENTILWISKDRSNEITKINSHNELVAKLPWYLRWFTPKWSDDWVKMLHWSKERTCCSIYKLCLSASEIYISAEDAETIGLHNEFS